MIIIKTQEGLVKAWVDGVELEAEAKQQIENCAGLPFVSPYVAVMPDAHAGCGSTVGTVIPTYKAIIPAAVGVDIGCGMIAVQTNITSDKLPDNLLKLRTTIEEAVPHGRSDNGRENDKGAWANDSIPHDVFKQWENLRLRWLLLKEKYPQIGHNRVINQLGTLGTGNHFIEICLDEANMVWVMLHSGSRGQGNKIGTFFIGKAKEEMEKWMIHLPDKDLSYLPEGSNYFKDYVDAVHWAQEYAFVNREIMMQQTLVALQKNLPEIVVQKRAINCHHNYVQKENHFGENLWITRKGAVSAKEGEMGIIPGSMGAKSFIVRGKGNPESFHSCSHGAGRKMSRTKARATFSIEEHEKATQGVECRKDIDVIDETPGAYKDIDAVMKAQKDLVEIVHTLKGVVCVKG